MNWRVEEILIGACQALIVLGMAYIAAVIVTLCLDAEEQQVINGQKDPRTATLPVLAPR